MSEEFDIRKETRPGEKEFENALRPLRFADFSGQRHVVENRPVLVEAARHPG